MANSNSLFYKEYPNLINSSMQLFNDQESGGGGQILTMSKQNIVSSKDSNKQGKGVFFSVNSMQKGTRSKATTTHINTWICESDDISKEEQIGLLAYCPIMPSMIIESKKSYHMYRFCDKGDKETWEQVNRGLAKYFKGDTKICSDRSRVLRMPGFYHMKDKDDPYKVDCIHFEKIYHSFDDMIKAYPYEKETSLPRQTSQSLYDDTGGMFGDSSIVRYAKSWDAREMLSQISGTSLVSGEIFDFKSNSNGTEQIVINGAATSCWIDKSGMIGSSDKGGPSWVEWVRYYHDKSSDYIEEWIYDNLKNRLSEDQISWYRRKRGIEVTQKEKKKEIEKKIEQTSSIRETGDVEISHGKKYSITRGTDEVDRILKKPSLQDFIIFCGYPSMGKTNYCLFMAEQNGKKGKKSTFFTLELSKRVMFERNVVEYAEVDWNDYLDGKYNDVKKALMDQRMKELNAIKNVNIVSSTKPLDIQTLMLGIRKFHKEGSSTFYVDNLGKIIGGAGQTENDRFEDITSKLQDLMKELDIIIILLHHLGKPMKGGENLPGGGSAFRGSQKIKDNCTCMIEIWFDRSDDADFESSSEIELIQYKRTRAGGVDRKGQVYFDAGTYINKRDFYEKHSKRLRRKKPSSELGPVDKDQTFTGN